MATHDMQSGIFFGGICFFDKGREGDWRKSQLKALYWTSDTTTLSKYVNYRIHSEISYIHM